LKYTRGAGNTISKSELLREKGGEISKRRGEEVASRGEGRPLRRWEEAIRLTSIIGGESKETGTAKDEMWGRKRLSLHRGRRTG